MNILLKAVACVLISSVLYHAIPSNKKEISLLLSIAVCCIVTVSALSYLQPVLSFFTRLQTLGNLNTQLMETLVKSVAVGLLAEITAVICKDVGNAALGKTLQILASAVILWLSLPVFEEFLTLVESVLGAI